MLTTIIVALIVLGLLVAVHEGGHFIAARLCGIPVEKFSVGFGKPIFKFVKGGVEYSLSWIPLGGYVKMKGDNIDQAGEDPDGFLNSPWWKRAIIAFAGPFTNLLFALIILIISFMFTQRITDHSPIIDQVNPPLASYLESGDKILEINGEQVLGWFSGISNLKEGEANNLLIERNGKEERVIIPNVTLSNWTDYSIIRPEILAIVGQVMPKSPAYNAGIKSGDKIISVDGVEVKNWYEMNQEISKDIDKVELKLARDGEILSKELSKMELPNEDRKLIGVTQYFPVKYEERLSFPQAIISGIATTTSVVGMHYVSLYQIIRKPKSLKNSIGGPVMIFSAGRDYIKEGAAKGLQFVAFLNIVLMVMNLLPIPVLDGGHIMFSFIEGIRGKKLSLKTQLVLQQLGIFFLLSLMIYAFYSDFSGLFSRYYKN